MNSITSSTKLFYAISAAQDISKVKTVNNVSSLLVVHPALRHVIANVLQSSQELLDMSEQPRGIYFIEIIASHFQKIILSD